MSKMTTFKPVRYIIIGAAMMLCYVHQQVEIVKTAYALDKNQKELILLLDQHQALVYNFNKLIKPSALEKRLVADRINLTMPAKEDIFYVTPAQDGLAGSAYASGNESIFIKMLDFFSTKAEAQVK